MTVGDLWRRYMAYLDSLNTPIRPQRANQWCGTMLVELTPRWRDSRFAVIHFWAENDESPPVVWLESRMPKGEEDRRRVEIGLEGARRLATMPRPGATPEEWHAGARAARDWMNEQEGSFKIRWMWGEQQGVPPRMMWA